MVEMYSAQKVEKIKDHLVIDTYKANNTNIGVNDMTANDSKKIECETKRQSFFNTGDISPEIA